MNMLKGVQSKEWSTLVTLGVGLEGDPPGSPWQPRSVALQEVRHFRCVRLEGDPLGSPHLADISACAGAFLRKAWRMQKDFLIIGQGLAGSLLYWKLSEAGATADVVDPGSPNSSTRVAPGVINPLAGKRLKPSWRVQEQLPCALAAYEAIGERLGQSFFVPKRIIRIIKDEKQLEFFEKRKGDPLAADFIGRSYEPNHFEAPVSDPLGSFEANASGYLQTELFILSFQDYLKDRGDLIEEVFRFEDLNVESDSVSWQGRSYRKIIFCQGWQGKENPFFNWVPFKAAKGEMLTLKTDSAWCPPDAIINRGKWILSIGNGYFKAGASYSWDPLDYEPSQAAAEGILGMLAEYLDVSFEVVHQIAGIRPIIFDYRPVLGLHPEHASVAFFNGLGSKGVLSSPWLAEQYRDFLLEDKPLPKEVRVERFIKRYRKSLRGLL